MVRHHRMVTSRFTLEQYRIIGLKSGHDRMLAKGVVSIQVGYGTDS